MFCDCVKRFRQGNGTVLIAGGFLNNTIGYLFSAELYAHGFTYKADQIDFDGDG